MSKKLLAALLTGSLLLMLTAAVWPQPTQAANLSGGAYTYVIDGEEVTFPYDPIVQKAGALLPLDLFTHLGAKVSGALEQKVTLRYGPVTAELTLGRNLAQVNGQAEQMATAPMRLNGRLFLPAEILTGFGLSLAQEGNYVIINHYVDEMPALTKLSEGDWLALTADRTIDATLRADSGIYLDGTFAILNEGMILDQHLKLDYGTRVRLLGLLQTNTLMLVDLANPSLKSGAIQTNGLYLVDGERNQYEVSQVLDIGQGLITGKVAPAANRMGLLVLPRLGGGGGPLKLYYEGNGAVLGQFPISR